ncbi:MAG: ABC-F family ATP-binding cassette domain-containing protein [Firmicutes bacterium]|nr:ABC-F family ATP-binding cassette domain-containing protein [Bacillota bacterium]
MIEISLRGIEKYYGANQVLADFNLEVTSGERVGIIGENGGGKTTVFKVIAGEGCEAGEVAIRKGASIGLLQQIPQYPAGMTAMNVLNLAFADLLAMQAELRRLESQMAGAGEAGLERVMTTYARLQEQFELAGGYAIEEKLGKVVRGLGLASLLEQQFASLSGGEKTTVELGRILLVQPDILLLDEPTNHLDTEAVEWLEEYLQNYQGTVLAISHDRVFLDRFARRIIEVDAGQAEVYHGNYSFYVEERSARVEALLEEWKGQQKRIKAMEAAIARYRDWGKRSDNPKFFRRARAIERELERMELLERPREKLSFNLSFNEAGSGRDVWVAEAISCSVAGRKLLDNASLHVRQGEKVALVGPNGCGKTTLLKLLLGEVQPDSGSIKIGARVRPGWLEQEVSFPDPEASVLDTFRNTCPILEGTARHILARFLFRGQAVFNKVGSLSGGEKSRLRLCQLVHSDVNTLVLDEPTNHLDIPAREVLEETLRDFAGTVLLVSHDRWFINRVSERVVELRGGMLVNYLGNYDYYRQHRRGPEEAKKTNKAAPEVRRPPRTEKPNVYKLEQLEQAITALEAELAAIDKEMAESASDYLRLQELTALRENRAAELEKLWAQI